MTEQEKSFNQWAEAGLIEQLERLFVAPKPDKHEEDEEKSRLHCP